MDFLTILTIVVICCSLAWSVGVLIFALIKKILLKRKEKQLEKDILNDDVSKE